MGRSLGRSGHGDSRRGGGLRRDVFRHRRRLWWGTQRDSDRDYLKENPRDIFVATKLGRMPVLYPDQYTAGRVRAAVDASLARLRVEAIDLIQLHCVPYEVMRRAEIFEWLRALRKEGKIKSFGASVESMDEALLCTAQPGLASLQIIFNILRQKPILALFPDSKEKGIAMIVRLPLASSCSPENSEKTRNSGPRTIAISIATGSSSMSARLSPVFPLRGVELAEAMKAFVPDGMSMSQMAQRWILDHEEVSVIIPGATSAAQARENSSVSNSLRSRGNLMIGREDFTRTRSRRLFAVPTERLTLHAGVFGRIQSPLCVSKLSIVAAALAFGSFANAQSALETGQRFLRGERKQAGGQDNAQRSSGPEVSS